MHRTWTDDHGEPGLRRKFDVYKPADDVRRPDPFWATYPRSARLGDDGEFVFVLRPETDFAACAALWAYAEAVQPRDPQLAADVERELARIREDNRARDADHRA